MTLITTTTHPLVDSAGQPWSGAVRFVSTSRFETGTALVSPFAALIPVVAGHLLLNGTAPDIPPTPDGQGMILVEMPDGLPVGVPRIVTIPTVPTEYADLIEIIPAPGTQYVVTSAALTAAIAAEASRADAAYVPQVRLINAKPLSADVVLAAGDIGAATAAQGAKADTAAQPADVASAITGEASARTAAITAAIAAEVTRADGAYARPVSTDGSYGLPAPTGTGLELAITATGLQNIQMNGVAQGLLTTEAANATYAPIEATKGAMAVLMDRLTLNLESAALYFIGDSTTVDVVANPNMALGTGQYLASLFPAYSVVYHEWNDTTQAYSAAVTVQTGTGTGNAGGPWVLDVYNASKSGADATYPVATMTRFYAMFPAVPTLAILNHGHNSTGSLTTGYARQQLGLIRALVDYFPKAALVQMAQTPRNPAGDSYGNLYLADLTRQRVIMSLAASEGTGLLNLTELFLANPTYVTDWISGDGLHPNATGYGVILQAVTAAFASSRRARPIQQLPRKSRIVKFATDATLYAGSPTLELVNNSRMGWKMPAAADSEIMFPIEIPEGWGSCEIYVEFTAAAGAAAGSREVAFLSFTQRQTVDRSLIQYNGAAAQPGGWTANQGATPIQGAAVTGATSYLLYATRLVPEVQVNGNSNGAAGLGFFLGWRTGLRVKRAGTNATYDKFASDIWVTGITVVRDS